MGKVGGSLKLKNAKSNETKINKNKNKLEKHKINITSNLNTTSNTNSNTSIQMMIKKTPAQLAFEAAQQKKQKQKLPILASKSHKEKVAEFNEYLGKLSEHHDIPRVGPG